MKSTMRQADVVITGVGMASPIGTGRDEFWASLCQARSGIARIGSFDPSALPVQIAGEVRNFEAKRYVVNRKSLKVMCRDAQLGMAAAALACRDAGLAAGAGDPVRFGVVLGADRICAPLDESETTYRRCMPGGKFDFRLWATEGMAASFPLGFLRVLPNMIASHISITHDARGPNNTIHHGELSSLLAVVEAASVICRGAADVMLAGGASAEMHFFNCLLRCVQGILSPGRGDPATACRPFDADRDGQVWGEGAAVFVLEDRRYAERRGANILARLLGWATACEAGPFGKEPQGTGLQRAMRQALERAGLTPGDLGHVNAHASGATSGDRIEAQAIGQVAPGVPVSAMKSYFGNLGAAAGAMELAASVLSFSTGRVPATLNYQRPDPDCPVTVVRGEPLSSRRPALAINRTPIGQAAAVVLAGE